MKIERASSEIPVKTTPRTARTPQRTSSSSIHPSLTHAASVHKPNCVFTLGNLTLNVFPDTDSLNRSVAELIKQEMQKGGLALLSPGKAPSGSKDKAQAQTQGGIYQFLDNLISRVSLPNSLTVSQTSEQDNPEAPLAKSLRLMLPRLIKKIGNRFKPIDINNFDSYVKLLNEGPRLIVGSLEYDKLNFPFASDRKGASKNKNLLPRRVRLYDNNELVRHQFAYSMGFKAFDAKKNPRLKTVILTANGDEENPFLVEYFKNALLNTKGLSPTAKVLNRFMRSKDLNGPKLFLNIDQSTFQNFLQDNDALYCLLHPDEFLGDQEPKDQYSDEVWEDDWWG